MNKTKFVLTIAVSVVCGALLVASLFVAKHLDTSLKLVELNTKIAELQQLKKYLIEEQAVLGEEKDKLQYNLVDYGNGQYYYVAPSKVLQNRYKVLGDMIRNIDSTLRNVTTSRVPIEQKLGYLSKSPTP